jgi:succinate-semialdehyde dehydrogenase/glutarate-semialdehyde dehydrogenase
MQVMKAEIFGPIVPLMKVSGEAEAVRLANESHLGLGAYVFTADHERGRRVAEQLQVGSVMINDVLTHAGMAEMPWGGIKQSGLGVVRSERGLKELCNARHINEERLPLSLGRDPYWFPYSAKSTRVVSRFLKTAFGGSLAGRLFRLIMR